MLRAGVAPLAGQTRGYATLKDISIRLKSVKNIQKITASMKMVAAAKYAQAERGLKPARPYGEGAMAFYEKTELGKPSSEEESPRNSDLILAMTSDRGLCGAVHSSVAKAVKADMAAAPDPNAVRIICVGDKAKAILQRQFKANFVATVNEIGRKPPTFEDASTIANLVLDEGLTFSQGDIYFNRFKSVVSYSTTKIPIFAKETVEGSDKLGVYDSLDSEVIQSYLEFSLASQLYYVLKENAASEQSSRMTAMDNASKNATEMIDKLTLLFNRTRQAVITRELIEIISGAAAL